MRFWFLKKDFKNTIDVDIRFRRDTVIAFVYRMVIFGMSEVDRVYAFRFLLNIHFTDTFRVSQWRVSGFPVVFRLKTVREQSSNGTLFTTLGFRLYRLFWTFEIRLLGCRRRVGIIFGDYGM